MKSIVNSVKRIFSTRKSTPSSPPVVRTWTAQTATYTEKDLKDSFFAVVRARAVLRPSATLASCIHSTRTRRNDTADLFEMLYSTSLWQWNFSRDVIIVEGDKNSPYNIDLTGGVFLSPGYKHSTLWDIYGNVVDIPGKSVGDMYTYMAAELESVLMDVVAAEGTVLEAEELDAPNWEEDEDVEAKHAGA